MKKGEKPENGAKRELKEETGFEAGKLEKICQFYVSPGYSTEYMHLFRATSLKKGRQSFEKNEIIKQVKIFNLKEILEMIEKKKIIDAKTILAIFSQIKNEHQKREKKIERENLGVVGRKRSGKVSPTLSR